MPARNVSLTPQLVDFVEQNVKTGRFSSASEVVREGLRPLEQRQAEDALKLVALRAAVAVGFEDMGAGRVSLVPAGGDIAAILATSSEDFGPGARDR